MKWMTSLLCANAYNFCGMQRREGLYGKERDAGMTIDDVSGRYLHLDHGRPVGRGQTDHFVCFGGGEGNDTGHDTCHI